MWPPINKVYNTPVLSSVLKVVIILVVENEALID